MLQIVYASKAQTGTSDDDLRAILSQSRRQNAARGITGALLHMDGVFLQALEGEEAVIRQLFETIRHDPRHDKIRELLIQPLIKPAFSDWAMGFAEIPAAMAEETGFFELTHETLADQLDEERADILLTLMGRMSDQYGGSDSNPT